ncbi:MAG: Hpt domain-containing protein [Rhodospirillaceae bacterium]|nr:Hpt domain-containing protein [Rhodospirillaceae bacterium]
MQQSNFSEAKFLDRLASIRSSFSAELPDRLEKIGLLLDELSCAAKSDATTQTLKILYEQTHNLAGTGGTLGFERLSHLSADLENICRNVLNENGKPSDVDLGKLLSKFILLRDELKDLQKTG